MNIRELLETLQIDFKRQAGEESWYTPGNLQLLLSSQGTWATLVYRLGRMVYDSPLPGVSIPAKLAYKMLHKWIEILTGISIPASVKIGKGLYIGHFGEIIIHSDAVIGDRFNIGQGVTIGTRGQGNEGVPDIGDDVYIGVGAKVLGGIRVGNNVSIGANAVVVKDIPDDSIAVGVPAKVMPKKRQD